jgi:hypothetical protein
MINFYPSPIECLIFRANSNLIDIKKIPEKKENEEKNESSRKILNEFSDNSNIVNSPKKILFYDTVRVNKNNIDNNIEINESGNKIVLELENLKKK